MSIWTDSAGRIHVGIMVAGQRIHRRLPEGATKGDAKSVEAELRRSVPAALRSAPNDPPMLRIMDLYMAHSETLRSPDTARFHALRCTPWCTDKKASEAEDIARKMISDMRGHYAPATVNRSLGAMKTALAMAYQQKMIPEDYGDRITRLPENNKRHIYLSAESRSQAGRIGGGNVSEGVRIALASATPPP